MLTFQFNSLNVSLSSGLILGSFYEYIMCLQNVDLKYTGKSSSLSYRQNEAPHRLWCIFGSHTGSGASGRRVGKQPLFAYRQQRPASEGGSGKAIRRDTFSNQCRGRASGYGALCLPPTAQP